MIILHDDAYYESRKPQPDLGALKNFQRFLWNGDRKTLLGRTASEWGQLGIFYLCFFSVLGFLFAVQMWISIAYVSQLDRPFFQYSGLSRAYTKRNVPFFRSPWNFGSPGIVFKPNSPLAITSPIIWVNSSSTIATPKRYIRALSDFLQEYNTNISNYDSTCREEKLRPDVTTKPCFFDIKTLGTCSKSPYGYTKPLQPCILIKFNKRFDWVPHSYNQSSNLPEDMPRSLKKIVKSSAKLQVWLSCDGANNVDKEHIGEIEYIPSPGFPVKFFPFEGQPHYLSPIIALRFKNLSLHRLITVECTLWAFNVDQPSRYSLDFQIIIVNFRWNRFFRIMIHEEVLNCFLETPYTKFLMVFNSVTKSQDQHGISL